ncbi:magnesium/cobalt transporter CorA [soil metagenome]
MSHASTHLDNGQWIEIHHPTTTDLEFLQSEFPFLHSVNVKDSLERVTHAKMSFTNDYLFLAITVPTGLSKEGRLENFEAIFFLTKDALITIVPGDRRFPGLTVTTPGSFAKDSGLLLYELLRGLYAESNDAIREIVAKVGAIDNQILSIQSPAIIREMAILQINLTYFITTLEASIPIFLELEREDTHFNRESMKHYWSDIADFLTEQRDVLHDQDAILTTLSRAHGMYMNHRTNYIISILTVFSAIFLPLNLIAGIYGMNLSYIPFSHGPESFAIVLGIMVVTALSFFAYLKWKQWT